jgi:hypothetical protein
MTLLSAGSRNVHTVRYFGLFAPRAKWRRLIVAGSPPASGATAPEGHDHHTCEHGNRYRLTWAQALSKVFAIDAARCPRCGQTGLQQGAQVAQTAGRLIGKNDIMVFISHAARGTILHTDKRLI